MDTVTSKLSGNLGERHHCINALVHEAHRRNTCSLQTHPGESALDRLFKIDLASKQRNVDYIIQTLKDDDMLYVNRALKSLWLLDPEYSNIINPIFLENELFPHMISPAVNKIIHWIQMHLRDPKRCQEFHEFYKERRVDKATNFLWHCSNEYVLYEFSNILEKVTPKLLKRLSEKVPQITKIYYDSLKDNETLLKYYLKHDTQFFANLKYLLKTDADVFFHVLENFFNPHKFAVYNADITKYIMQHYRSRFIQKPELYTVCFLDIHALARSLSSEEIKDLVLKLARAEYVKYWFSFQNVEPLVKRLNKNERALFNTLVFVDKAFGPKVKEWPYPVPVIPVLANSQTGCLFDDKALDIYHCDDGSDRSEDHGHRFSLKKKERSRKEWPIKKSLLEMLFHKYRFFNYKQTFDDLHKQLKAESSPQNRRSMLLVLISKTGQCTEDIVSLLDLLEQHKNEPVHIRAALVRSLVTRASVWRLPSEHWARLLKWGHGLGLDGGESEACCYEGIHAVVIHDLLVGRKPDEAVWGVFINSYFNTLRKYALNTEERSRVSASLTRFLLTDALSSEISLFLLNYLLDTLEAYRIKFDELPGVVEAVTTAVKQNCNTMYKSEFATKLLYRLYNAGIARKKLIRDYFEIIQTEASYVNALKHDISILGSTEKLEKLIEGQDLKHFKFFRKLALYFMEKDGLGKRYYAALVRSTASVPVAGRQLLALPLALLSGSEFPSLLKTFDEASPKTPKRRLAAALRSYAHVVRPAFDLESFGWRKTGAKAVANRVAVCRRSDVDLCLQRCLTWRRTLRLALVPGKRINKERDVFEVLASKRPGAALQAALQYFRRKGDDSDPCIWELVKRGISRADSRHLRLYINFTPSIPAVIKPEYCFLVYMTSKIEGPYFRLKATSEIPALLPELDEEYVFDAIGSFMRDYFKDSSTVKNMVQTSRFHRWDYKEEMDEDYIRLHIEIIAKFLVLSTSKEMAENRYRKIALPFLNQLQIFWNQKDFPVDDYIDLFLYHLRYNKIYFDNKYVYCENGLKRIKQWMDDILPVEMWFGRHLTVQLTINYLKSCRLLLEENPAFSERNKPEMAQILGKNFSILVAKEIDELSQKYFPSIAEIYGSELLGYFHYHIYRKNDECFSNFTVAFINALLTNKSVGSCIVAKYVFVEFHGRLKSEHINDILEQLNITDVRELRVIDY